jgi:hypothetical protein
MYSIVKESVSDISLYFLYKNNKVVLMTNRYDLALRELNKKIDKR